MGLYANIAAKRRRIAEGSGEKMRKVGTKGAPTAKDFKQSAKTAKKKYWLRKFIRILMADLIKKVETFIIRLLDLS
jgi:hypothetical protein